MSGMDGIALRTKVQARAPPRPARYEGTMPNIEQLRPNLYRYTDTCNVYVLKDGDAALLIDLGDGGVLDHLASIGVKRVEWVLFTHHHREQCQGATGLKATGAKIACSTIERPLFEKPA